MGQKRRRIALSCIDCRRRKVKCDRTYPACVRCQTGGYGDKCLYVSDTAAEPSSIGLPTPEDDRRRRSGSENTWDEEAEQYQNAAHNHENETQARTNLAPKSSRAQFNRPPLPLDASQREIASLRGKITELQSLGQAGQNPRPFDMPSGLTNVAGPESSRVRNGQAYRGGVAGQERVLLRGKSFKTQYFGPSSALSILLQFEDLSKFVREILMALPSLQNTKQAMSKLRQKEKEALKSSYDTSLEGLVKMVPERQYADRLLHHYLDTIETTYRILHVPTFLKDYQQFWEAPNSTKTEFVVQLLAVLSSMYCIVPGGEEGFVGRSSAKLETATHWIGACTYWLESQSKKHVTMVYYQLHLQLWISKRINGIKIKQYWTESGRNLHKLMAAGFHREPTLLCGKINAFECEMRRRLWYTALELDLQSCIDKGMTPSLRALDWDTNPPLNVDDEDLDPNAESSPGPRGRETFTRTSFLTWAAESLPLRLELVYKINSIRSVLSFDTASQYDNQLREFLEDIPFQDSKVAETEKTTDVITTDGSSAQKSSKTPATASAPLILAHSILYELLTLVHQPLNTESLSKSAQFQGTVARRFACLSTILLYNPQLNKAGTQNKPSDDARSRLDDVQKNFFSFMREDYLRATLSLSHDYAIRVSQPGNFNGASFIDEHTLVNCVSAAVEMLRDRVHHSGQGFHGYWISSSALSFVHSKQNPNVPRLTFIQAAADRLVKLHNVVVDGQLPRAKRLMMDVGVNDETSQPVVMGTTAGITDSIDNLKSNTTFDGSLRLPGTFRSGVYHEGLLNTCLSSVDVHETGATAFDATKSTSPFEDMIFDIENMDWDQLMNTDPTAWMMGTWDIPT